MDHPPTLSVRVLNILEGTWKGEGRGQFPGVLSFQYQETLSFTRRDEKTIAYEQRTLKCYDGQTEVLPSHWENGFLSVLEDSSLQLVNIQIGGRNEVLVGMVEPIDPILRIHFKSKALNNDQRMVSSARVFELENDILRYEMEMQTTKVEQSTPHLKIVLQRVK